MKQPNQFSLHLLAEISHRPTTGGITLREHLIKQWREAILIGRLPPNFRLPSTRQLAEHLHIGRSTLVEVIEQLALEGYLHTHRGTASRVAAVKPASLRRTEAFPIEKIVCAPQWQQDDPPTAVTLRAFRPGLPDLASFPAKEWAQCLARRAKHPVSHDLSYRDLTGMPALRRELLLHLQQTRGIHAQPEQLIIVPSAQAAFDILIRASLEQGNIVWLEDPGYHGVRAALRAAKAHIVGLPIDQEGMILAEDLPPPQLIYVTPSHQYPTGITMSLARRLMLLEYAAEHQALIIEDDNDSEYQFRGQPIASLQSLDQQDCVAYVGTFSKVMAPGLRVAYAIVPKKWLPLVETIMTVSGHGVSVHVQLALADFIAGGGLRRHLRRANHEAAQKMQCLVQCLRRSLRHSSKVTIPTPLGGLQLCLTWHGKTPDTVLIQALQQHGITATALSSFYHGNAKQGMLLGVGLISLEEIESAVQTLAEVIHTIP